MRLMSNITEDMLPGIVKRNYPSCRNCKQSDLDVAFADTVYDSELDDVIVMSFDVVCKRCGHVAARWERTDTRYIIDRSA